MNRHVHWALIGFILATPSLFAQANAPGSGDQLQQLTVQLQQSPGDQALREKIIALALTINPKPATPDAATMAEGAAEYAFKNAKATSGFSDAAKQYEKALLLAPWLAADYFNCGVAYERAGDNKEAIRSFNLYLLAAPNADDAQAVKGALADCSMSFKRPRNKAMPQRGRPRSKAPPQRGRPRCKETLQRGRKQLESKPRMPSVGLTEVFWQGTHDDGVNANGSHYHDEFYVNATYIAIDGLTVRKYVMTVNSSDNRRVTKVPYNPNAISPSWTGTLTSHMFNGPPSTDSRVISYVDEFTISDDGKSIAEKWRLADVDNTVASRTTNYVRIK